jgi:hypothetical protein
MLSKSNLDLLTTALKTDVGKAMIPKVVESWELSPHFTFLGIGAFWM